MDTKILCINPGSTSTKVAVYQNEEPLFCQTLRHTPEELAPYSKISDQMEMRRQVVLNCLKEHNIPVESLSAVVGRGGMLPPVQSGAYQVNDAMLQPLSLIHI